MCREVAILKIGRRPWPGRRLDIIQIRLAITQAVIKITHFTIHRQVGPIAFGARKITKRQTATERLIAATLGDNIYNAANCPTAANNGRRATNNFNTLDRRHINQKRRAQTHTVVIGQRLTINLDQNTATPITTNDNSLKATLVNSQTGNRAQQIPNSLRCHALYVFCINHRHRRRAIHHRGFKPAAKQGNFSQIKPRIIFLRGRSRACAQTGNQCHDRSRSKPYVIFCHSYHPMIFFIICI